MERTDRDAAGHHNGHDGERALVEKLDEQLALIAITRDATGVLDRQFVEHHEPKHDANDDRERNVQDAYVTKGVFFEADVRDVRAGSKPHRSGYQQKREIPHLEHSALPSYHVNDVHLNAVHARKDGFPQQAK